LPTHFNEPSENSAKVLLNQIQKKYGRDNFLKELFTLVLYQSFWLPLLPIYYRISALAPMQHSNKIILHNSDFLNYYFGRNFILLVEEKNK
ncbi:hypothetical protein, partial [Akkermansia sp.]|uniref:hypothetical protein n=1 Tax=Akkermansia sp. TaxID=1872421 RepID=UPI0039963E58